MKQNKRKSSIIVITVVAVISAVIVFLVVSLMLPTLLFGQEDSKKLNTVSKTSDDEGIVFREENPPLIDKIKDTQNFYRFDEKPVRMEKGEKEKYESLAKQEMELFLAPLELRTELSADCELTKIVCMPGEYTKASFVVYKAQFQYQELGRITVVLDAAEEKLLFVSIEGYENVLACEKYCERAFKEVIENYYTGFEFIGGKEGFSDEERELRASKEEGEEETFAAFKSGIHDDKGNRFLYYMCIEDDVLEFN